MEVSDILAALDFNTILISILLPILYAVSGAWEAQQVGEKIDWVIFGKTIFLGLVSAGILSQATADGLIQILGTAIVTKFLDKLANAILNKVARTSSG
jgi:hypothetical protein